MPFNKRRAGKALLVVAVLIVVVFLLLLPPTQDLLRKYLVDPFSPHYPEEVTMEFSRTIVLDANGGHVIDYVIDIPRPVSLTENGSYTQHITSMEISPHYDALWDNGTYDTMVWGGDDLYGNITVTLTYEVTQTLYQWNLDEDTVLDKDEVQQGLLGLYLDDEWKIVVDDPVIEDLSREIVGNETNVYLIARAIYDWMVENIDYSTVPGSVTDPKSSLETYDDREGDCDDQSILFCALARSAGVPAWLQLGTIYERSTETMSGHGWVQMCMPTEEGTVNVTIDIVNRNFLVWMPNLFCEYTDNGNAYDLNNTYHTVYASYHPGEPTPLVSQSYNVLSYEESEETVTLSAALMARVEDYTLR